MDMMINFFQMKTGEFKPSTISENDFRDIVLSKIFVHTRESFHGFKHHEVGGIEEASRRCHQLYLQGITKSLQDGFEEGKAWSKYKIMPNDKDIRIKINETFGLDDDYGKMCCEKVLEWFKQQIK